MNPSCSRRVLLKALVAAAGAGAVAGTVRRVAAAPEAAARLDPRDPAAVALAYVTDAARVDPKTEPSFVAGHSCANCMQLQGTAGDPYRPCGAFAGKLVDVKGWCRAWTPEM